MTREEFEAELVAYGFSKDVCAGEWRRAADALNEDARIPFDAIDDAELFYGVAVYSVLLGSVLSTIDTPSAVDRLADIARSDDESDGRAGLVIGGGSLCHLP